MRVLLFVFGIAYLCVYDSVFHIEYVCMCDYVYMGFKAFVRMRVA